MIFVGKAKQNSLCLLRRGLGNDIKMDLSIY
jgi:hypothetical protein